jgi:hypothetical protein
MARFGVEGIRYFNNARAAGVSTAADLTYTFNICNGFDEVLRDHGHTRAFYWANEDCYELDLRDVGMGGLDDDWSDDVDLFFISTHGGNDAGISRLLYNAPQDNWRTYASQWRLGNDNIEWLMMYACTTVNLDHVVALWDAFRGMHQICGAWDSMWDGWTTDECGEDVAQNLVDGYTVADAWIDGVSDWWVDNHPVVVSAETMATYNGGNFNWPQTTLYRDHLWGHGSTVADITPAVKGWLSWSWAEG